MIRFFRQSKNFLEYWEDVKHLFRERPLRLFLDFDGTLAPIVEKPEKAALSPETKALLQILSREHSVVLTIVTGRALADVRQKVGIPKIRYVANHGFEIEGLSGHFCSLVAPKTLEIYREIGKEIRTVMKKVPEIIFEDKGSTLSIHYRLVPEEKKNFVKKAIRRIVKPYIQLREVSLRDGKEVMEVRPPIKWDKGTAVLWLLRSGKEMAAQETVILYIGDDETDEDAFKALQGRAMTIRVGNGKASAAQYCLKDVRQVHELLSRIAEVKRKAK